MLCHAHYLFRRREPQLVSAQYLGWCRTVLKPSLLTWWNRWEKIWMVRLALSLLRLSSDITELSTEIIPETDNWFVYCTIVLSPAEDRAGGRHKAG